MNSYTAWRMNVVAYGVWVGLSLIAGMIIPGLAICARTNEPQVDYSLTETTSKLPLWSMGEIIVKFENDVAEDYRNLIIREYGCSVVGRCLFSNVQLEAVPRSRLLVRRTKMTPLGVITNLQPPDLSGGFVIDNRHCSARPAGLFACL